MDDMVIHAILISEFHDNVGKQIFYKYPSGQQLVDDRDSNYMIDLIVPKDELCGRVIVFDFKELYQIISFAVLLRHDKNQKIYLREKYIFSIALCVQRDIYTKNPNSIQEAIRKLAFLLTTLESNSHCVYNHNTTIFSPFIEQAYTELNNSKQSIIEFNEDTYIFIRILDKNIKQQQVDIKIYEVPLPIVQLQTGILTEFDPVLEKLIPEINGISCVGTIIENLGKYTFEQIQLRLGNLIKTDLIKMVDIINMTNRYCVKEESYQFFNDQRQVCSGYQFIFKQSNNDYLLQKKTLQSLYYGFRRDIKLSQYIQNNKKLLQTISIHNLIRFGEVNNIIYRLYEYPIKLKPEQTRNFFDRENQQQYLQHWIPPSYRFRFEDKQTRDKPSTYKIIKPHHHCVQHSLEFSQQNQTHIISNLYQCIFIFYLKNYFQDGNLIQNQEEQLKNANTLMNQLIQEQSTVDEICLFFNIDLEGFSKFCKPIEIYIINK